MRNFSAIFKEVVERCFCLTRKLTLYRLQKATILLLLSKLDLAFLQRRNSLSKALSY